MLMKKKMKSCENIVSRIVPYTLKGVFGPANDYKKAKSEETLSLQLFDSYHEEKKITLSFEKNKMDLFIR